jgi:hypothetical protein
MKEKNKLLPGGQPVWTLSSKLTPHGDEDDDYLSAIPRVYEDLRNLWV